MEEYLIRFVAGGLVVSAFAVVGDVLRPKTFAGLFGAAPSVAVATTLLAVFTQGSAYAAIEGRSMMIGALALGIYSLTTGFFLKRSELSVLASSLLALPGWFACSLALYWLLLAGS